MILTLNSPLSNHWEFPVKLSFKKEIMEMANKQREKLRQERAKAVKQKNIIQAVGMGLVAVIVIAVVWIFLSNRANTIQPVEVPPVTSKQYDAPPPMTIDVKKQYFARVKLAKGGEFVMQLFPDKAPITVNSFVFLAREEYFTGVTFHRVLPGFMAQGGDPTGKGTGGPGYEFVNEDNDLMFDKAGVVAMANAGRNTNGSQFFITFGPAEYLNGDYTIFGQVIEGMDVVNNITLRDPNKNPDFPGDAIESISITEQ
jgi:peptidylprolyl isomerase